MDVFKTVAPGFDIGRELEMGPEEATFFETSGALLGQYKPVISNFVDAFDQELMREDPEFDVVQSVFEMPPEYHQYSSTFLFARNDDHLEYLRGKVDAMIERRRTIENSSTGNVLLASFFDPINLISLPIGVTTSVAKSALRTGVANAAIVAAESRLNSNLDVTNDNVTTLTTTVDNFGTSSNSNAAALASEDAALQSRLSTNVTALTNEDTALQSRLSTNVTAFTNEDTALQARLSTNVTAFTNEDTALQARIAANALVAASNDYITYTRLNANVDVVQDNVATLTTTVDNFGTSSNTNAAALASGIVASEVRVNANLDVTNDNVANITDGTTPFSAPVTFTDNVTISGSLIVTGAQVDLGVQSATVDNNFIELSAELAPGDAPATDSGLLINRGNKGNVFIGDHLGEDGVIFARTQTPDTNTIVAIESFMDLHANAIHVASPVNLNRVHVGLRASENTGIIFDDSGANINFVADGSYVANVHYDGTLNSQNAIIAPAVFAGGVELQANDSATLFSARANDFATYTHITANVDVVQDNVATLTTTVDNHGTYSNTNFDTKANVSATFIQLNANVDVVQDNVVAAESNVSAVESRRVSNIAGAVSTITTGDLTASRALASDGSGKVAVSAVTSTELGYLDGVTSAIQTQIDSKSSTSNAAALAAGIAGITPIGTSDIADNAVTVGKLAATLDLGALS